MVFPVNFLLMDMCGPHVIGATGKDGPIDSTMVSPFLEARGNAEHDI
jgi:hypothetical protein